MKIVPDDFELTDEDRRAIRAALARIDPKQAEIDRNLTMAESFAKGFAIVEAVRQYNIYWMQQEHPELSEAEAQRLFLARYYALEKMINAR
jgi:hypothetical protein